MPYLVFDDDFVKKAVPIAANSGGSFKIGRDLENDLKLHGDASVSREHCEIFQDGDVFVLKDFSSNGTLVGDDHVVGGTATIREGAYITVGRSTFTFHDSDTPPCELADTTTISLPPLEPVSEPTTDNAPEIQSQIQEDDDLVFQDTAQLAPIHPPNSEDESIELPEIKGFELIRTLGTGNHSTTYLAFQAGLKRTVALKVFKVDNDGPRPKEFFLESVRAAASVTHKNIVPLFDAGHVGSLYFVVMHYAGGGSLRRKMQEGGLMTVKDTVTLGTTIAAALSQLKDIRLIHANITPDNILFEKDGDAMLADAGLPHWIASVLQPDRNIFCGNPTYMPPEQALDAETDWTCDQYSLGVILFEMLTGIPPFTASSPDLLIRKHLKEKLHFPDKPKIPTPLKNTLAKMMSKNPNRRFATWDDVAMAMRFKESPPSGMDRSKKAMRKTIPNLAKTKKNLAIPPKRKKTVLKLK